MADAIIVKVIENLKNMPSGVSRSLGSNRYFYCRCTDCNRVYPTYIVGRRQVQDSSWEKYCPFCNADLGKSFIFRSMDEREVISIRYDEEIENWKAYDEFNNEVVLSI